MSRVNGVRVDLLDGQCVDITPLHPTVSEPWVIALDIQGEYDAAHLTLTQDQWDVLKAVLAEY